MFTHFLRRKTYLTEKGTEKFALRVMVWKLLTGAKRANCKKLIGVGRPQFATKQICCSFTTLQPTFRSHKQTKKPKQYLKIKHKI